MMNPCNVSDDQDDGDSSCVLRPLLAAAARDHPDWGQQPVYLQQQMGPYFVDLFPLAVHEQQLLQSHHLPVDEPEVPYGA